MEDRFEAISGYGRRGPCLVLSSIILMFLLSWTLLFDQRASYEVFCRSTAPTQRSADQLSDRDAREMGSRQLPWLLDMELNQIIVRHIRRRGHGLSELQAAQRIYCVHILFAPAPHAARCQILHEVQSFLFRLHAVTAVNFTVFDSLASQCDLDMPRTAACGSHRIWLIDLADPFWPEATDTLKPTSPPTCGSCSSQLIIAHSANISRLEEVQDMLMDENIRWVIERDISRPLDDGRHWFALRQIALPQNEQQFLTDLHHIQSNTASCEKQKYIVRSLGNSGFASQIHLIARMLRQAVMLKRAVLIYREQEFFYMTDDLCKGKGMDCYFHSPLFYEHRCLTWAQQEWTRDPSLLDARHKTNHSYVFWHLGNDYEWLNTDAEFLRLRHLDVHGPLPALALSQPRRFIRQLMKPVIERFPDSSSHSRFIGVHIRHGDKIKEYPLIPFTEYLEVLDYFHRLFFINLIYIATDNATIISHDIIRSSFFHFIYQEIPRFGGSPGAFWAHATSDRLQLFVSVLIDIYVLASSAVFIGTQNSGLSVLIQQIRQLHHPGSPNVGIEAASRQLRIITPYWQLE